MARFFIDLDGVLADFDGGCVRLFGMGPREFIEINGERVFWKRLAQTDGFYDGLDWMPGAIEMLASMLPLIRGSGDVPMILTGLPLGDWAALQKRTWCAAQPELLGVPVITCMSRDKKDYCEAGDVLLDDRASAGPDWRAAGGVFMLHVDPALTLAAVQDHYGG